MNEWAEPTWGKDQWHVQLRRFDGRKPWCAFITEGITKLDCGTVFASKGPEQALEKALRVIARRAPQEHPNQITIEVSVTPGGVW